MLGLHKILALPWVHCACLPLDAELLGDGQWNLFLSYNIHTYLSVGVERCFPE